MLLLLKPKSLITLFDIYAKASLYRYLLIIWIEIFIPLILLY